MKNLSPKIEYKCDDSQHFLLIDNKKIVLTMISNRIHKSIYSKHTENSVDRLGIVRATAYYKTIRYSMGRQSGHSELMYDLFKNGIQIRDCFVDMNKNELLTNGSSQNCVCVFNSYRYLKIFKERFGIENTLDNYRRIIEVQPTNIDNGICIQKNIEFLIVDDMMQSTLGLNSSPAFSIKNSELLILYPNLKCVIILQ